MPDGFAHYVKTYGKEMSMNDLADSFQVSVTTIRKWMEREEIPIRPRKNVVDKERIIAFLNEGKSANEIMDIMKCSRSIINDQRRKIRRGGQGGKS